MNVYNNIRTKFLNFHKENGHAVIPSAALVPQNDPTTREINIGAPDPMSFLSSSGKKHFKEVLEYLDEMGIVYQIDKTLVRGLSYYTHTVFEIIETAEDGSAMTIAGGGRYDYLGKMLGSKKDIPAMGGSIGMDRIIERPWFKGKSTTMGINSYQPVLYYTLSRWRACCITTSG
jgi:histidyl-tRNA synthetase